MNGEPHSQRKARSVGTRFVHVAEAKSTKSAASRDSGVLVSRLVQAPCPDTMLICEKQTSSTFSHNAEIAQMVGFHSPIMRHLLWAEVFLSLVFPELSVRRCSSQAWPCSQLCGAAHNHSTSYLMSQQSYCVFRPGIASNNRWYYVFCDNKRCLQTLTYSQGIFTT
jgi:hypothetical protein